MVREAAADDVELAAKPGRKAADVRLEEHAVVESACARGGVRDLDHACGQVNPDRLALGDERGDAAKLAAGAAAGVHHA
jgi:hypothetical protein